MNPEARRDGLIVERIGGALVVYDVDREQAHSLNPTAALVWQHCDGAHSVQDLVLLAQDQLHTPASAELVEMTLSTLDKAHLLLQPVSAHHGVSRRELLTSLGVAAAALPVITTIMAPEPALARSGDHGDYGGGYDGDRRRRRRRSR